MQGKGEGVAGGQVEFHLHIEGVADCPGASHIAEQVDKGHVEAYFDLAGRICRHRSCVLHCARYELPA